MQKRKEMKRDGRNTVEYSLLCKLIRRKVIDDIHAYKQQRILKAAKERKSIKKCRRNLMLYTQIKCSSRRRWSVGYQQRRNGRNLQEIFLQTSRIAKACFPTNSPTIPRSITADSDKRGALCNSSDGRRKGTRERWNHC